jgi:hypothetical protein
VLRPVFGFLFSVMLVPFISGLQAQSPRGASSRSPSALQTESYLATRTRLSSAAKTAFILEMAREKAGDCKDASSTLDAVTCFAKEGQITTSNYEAMTRNLRALLALADADAPASVVGPTGEALTPAQQAAEFDRLQENWDVYRKTVQSAAYDQFKGGTAAPVSNALADQMVVRSHMQELAAIYDFILGSH